jgi:hypothetical protein
MMEALKQSADKLTDSISNYAETYYKLTVLKVADKATGIASNSLTVATMLLIGLFTLFFLSMALAFWLGDLLNSYAAGFLIVGLLFAVIIGIVVGLRKKIVFPFIRNKIIRNLYD